MNEDFNKNTTDLIFENYSTYLTDHRDDVQSPSVAIEMLATDGKFNAYINTLTEGLNEHQKANVMAVCQREREMLLEESATLGPSSSVIGYAVNM